MGGLAVSTGFLTSQAVPFKKLARPVKEIVFPVKLSSEGVLSFKKSVKNEDTNWKKDMQRILNVIFLGFF